MTSGPIFCIVEGDGEVESMGGLLRRIEPVRRVLRPWRRKRQRLVKPGMLEIDVEFASRRLAGKGTILVLLDADDDLPCVLGPHLLARARAVTAVEDVRVVIARREYEAWFLGALESLRGKRGIPLDAPIVDDPESVRGAKELLGRLMGRRYSPTIDQPAFTALFDMDIARKRCPSFDKLLRDLGH